MNKVFALAFVFSSGLVHAALPADGPQPPVIILEQKVSAIQGELTRKIEKYDFVASLELARSIREAAESLAQVKTTRYASTDQVSPEQSPAPVEYSLTCLQVRGAAIFAFGGQIGLAGCYDGSKFYLIKYLTPNVNGFPLTIGAGGGAVAGVFYLTSDSLDITGRFSCSHEGGAYFFGAAALQCIGKDKDGKPRSLNFWGGNVGFQAELGVFPIEIE